MSLMNSIGLGGIFGSQASQGSIQNLPAQPGQWVTTTSNNTQSILQGQYNAAIQGSSQQTSTLTHSLLEENKKLLVEIKDELLDMKKWLIATYPDIYKQYVCVKQLEEASK
jgi:hypothetical protein